MPTGSVQFYDGSKILGSSSLSNGRTTASGLSGGTHTIAAVYSGGGGFPSASASILLTVTAPITMTISAAPSAAVFGQPVTLTVTVGATTVPAGLSQPTGQVTLFLASNPFSSVKLATVTLASGATTLSLGTLPAGTYYIEAQYSGDSTWPAISGQKPLIMPAATTTALSPAIASGQVVLTGTIPPQPPGSGTHTGNVQFVDTSNHNAVVLAPIFPVQRLERPLLPTT